jgi:hypothetical protein
LKLYFQNCSDDNFSKRKELQDDMREFLKTVKTAQQMRNPRGPNSSQPQRTKSASSRKKSVTTDSSLKPKSMNRTLTVGSHDFRTYLILDESTGEIGRGYDYNLFFLKQSYDKILLFTFINAFIVKILMH